MHWILLKIYIATWYSIPILQKCLQVSFIFFVLWNFETTTNTIIIYKKFFRLIIFENIEYIDRYWYRCTYIHNTTQYINAIIWDFTWKIVNCNLYRYNVNVTIYISHNTQTLFLLLFSISTIPCCLDVLSSNLILWNKYIKCTSDNVGLN